MICTVLVWLLAFIGVKVFQDANSLIIGNLVSTWGVVGWTEFIDKMRDGTGLRHLRNRFSST